MNCCDFTSKLKDKHLDLWLCSLKKIILSIVFMGWCLGKSNNKLKLLIYKKRKPRLILYINCNDFTKCH